MISPNSRLIPLIRDSGFLLAMGFASTVWAQPGMGPDPYRPFTSQYDAFTYPIAPGRGDVVSSDAALSRSGLSRNNQFQEYLRGTQIGAGNSSYRTQRQLNAQASRESQYQPNRKVDEESGYHEKQEFVSQAYFSYLREKDPKKRSELLKEYQQARAKPARDFAISRGRRPPRRNQDESATASRSGRRPTSRARRPEAGSRSDIPAAPRLHPEDRRTGGNPAPPPPPPREGRGADSSKPPAPTPSDTLEESLRRDRELRSNPSSRANSAASSRSRSSDRIPSPPRIRGASPSPETQ
jgi:hypothetical protein